MAASDAPHDRFHAQPVAYVCPGCGRRFEVRREPPRGTRCHRCRPVDAAVTRAAWPARLR